jgi:SET domain-containing protein 6
MRSIKSIAKGEQIYNTYGNLPNSDLLRRYGYVLPDSKDNIVEISADLIIGTISNLDQEAVERRIEILDDEDLFEECVSCLSVTNIRAYEIPYSGKIPEEMYVFCLTMAADKVDPENIPVYEKTAELRTLVLAVLSKRMSENRTSIEEDLKLLQENLPLRRKMAIEVRLGEKQILKKAIDRVGGWTLAPSTKRQKTR